MDRPIKKKFFTQNKIAGLVTIVALLTLSIYALGFHDRRSSYYVDKDRVVLAEVKRGELRDWIPASGSVVPEKTVYLDVIDGGQIESIYVEEGEYVKQNDSILTLNNTNLLLDIMNREAELSQLLNEMRNTRLTMAQRSLDLKSEMLEIDHQIQRQQRLCARNAEMAKKGLISDDETAQTQEDLDYLQSRRNLTLQTYQQDSLFRQVQIQALEESVDHTHQNLKIVKERLDKLTLRAPIEGQLTSLNAEIGELKTAGSRIGQIDVVDKYLIRCQIDEHYLARTVVGLQGDMSYNGNDYQLVVTKVYPEVSQSRFDVDMNFISNAPPEIRRGQSVRVQIELGSSIEAVLLPRGGFYSATGGRWVFVVDPSGEYAVRRNLKLGRQNVEEYEVLEGLEPGDEVVVSSYSGFDHIEKLIFK